MKFRTVIKLEGVSMSVSASISKARGLSLSLLNIVPVGYLLHQAGKVLESDILSAVQTTLGIDSVPYKVDVRKTEIRIKDDYDDDDDTGSDIESKLRLVVESEVSFKNAKSEWCSDLNDLVQDYTRNAS